MTTQREPVNYHREFGNDIAKPSVEHPWLEKGQAIALVALPLISQYKPFGFLITSTMGTARVWTSSSQLFETIKHGNVKEASYHTLQTTIAVLSLASTFFAHPIGMILTIGQDLIIEAANLNRYLRDGEYQKAIESCLKIINNSFYLCSFLQGGIELTIASLAMQIVLGIYQAQGELRNGRYLESSGQLLMVLMRGTQLAGQVKMLQMKLGMEKLVREAEAKKSNISGNSDEENVTLSLKNTEPNAVLKFDKTITEGSIKSSNEELINILTTYGNNKYKVSALTYAIHCGDFDAAYILIKNGADVNCLEGYLIKPRTGVQKVICHYMYPLERAFHVVCDATYPNKSLCHSSQTELLPKLVSMINYCLHRINNYQGYRLTELSMNKMIPMDLCFRIIDLFHGGCSERILNGLIFPLNCMNGKEEFNRKMQIARRLKKNGSSFGWLNIHQSICGGGRGNAQEFINYLDALKQEGVNFNKNNNRKDSEITILLKEIISSNVSDWDNKNLILDYLIKNGAKF